MPPNPAKTAGVGSGNGFMDFKYIPKDPQNRGYACGANDNQVYLRHFFLSLLYLLFCFINKLSCY